MIEYSVGFRGVNEPNDVLLIQNALTVWRAGNGAAWLALDGLVGPQTIGAIRDFQSFNGLITDGRIDPNGPTLAQLRAVLGEEAAVWSPWLPVPGAPPSREIPHLKHVLSILGGTEP
jgi:peptidoglycan hydrolase-like protein with peptidoglycan-binding domain